MNAGRAARVRGGMLMLPVRWSGLAMALGLALAGLLTEAAVAMLVALAQVLAWRLRLPRPWETALSATAMIAAVSSYLRLYERWGWWDVPVHLLLTGLLAVLAVRALRRETPGTIVGAGTALAIAWELLERWGHERIDRTVEVALGDTLLDIAVGVLGAVISALLRHRELRHRELRHRELRHREQPNRELRRRGSAPAADGLGRRGSGESAPGPRSGPAPPADGDRRRPPRA